MRSVPALAAVAIGVVALASGCGQRNQGTPAGPPLGGSSPASAAPSPSPVSQPSDPAATYCHGASAPHTLVTITYADNGRKVCVRPGTQVQVYLKGTTTNRWSPIHASSTVLMPHANGRMMLALGVTGASYVAARPGDADLRSFRQVCGPDQTPPNAGSQSGTMECGVIIAFHVTVKVT
jgi:hypothetical protein